MIESTDYFLINNEKKFIEVIVERLRYELSDVITGHTDFDVQKMVFYGIKKAKSYGFKFDVDIAAFITVMFNKAPNFDEHPFIHQLLIDELGVDYERFDHILQNIPVQVWREVESRYDARAWIPELKANRNTRLRRYTQVNRG